MLNIPLINSHVIVRNTAIFITKLPDQNNRIFYTTFSSAILYSGGNFIEVRYLGSLGYS